MDDNRTMGKEKSSDPVTTRNSNRNSNKKDKEQSVGKGNSGSLLSNRNRNQRHIHNSLSPEARNSLQQKPPQNPDNTKSPSPPHQRSSLDKSTRAPIMAKVNTNNSPLGTVPLIPNKKNNQDNIMPRDDGDPTDPPTNNAEMWASIMSKLNSMQAEQNEALQEIKEEIKTTNSGFTHDISLLRTDIDKVKNQVLEHESKWEELAKFKQEILDEVKIQLASQSTQVSQEVKNQLASQSTQVTQEVKQSIMVDVNKKIEDQNLHFEEKLTDERSELCDQFVGKRDFLKEKSFNRRLNLILLGLAEPAEEGDEREDVLSLLQNRLSIAAPKIECVYRLGAKGEGTRPRLVC